MARSCARRWSGTASVRRAASGARSSTRAGSSPSDGVGSPAMLRSTEDAAMTHVSIIRPIAPLIDRIREQFHPRQIWLFGSRARGDNRDDSDWDLLAVV